MVWISDKDKSIFIEHARSLVAELNSKKQQVNLLLDEVRDEKVLVKK